MSGPSCTVHREVPAVATWLHQNQVDYDQPALPLCQASLDRWFDNADDAPELEPLLVTWLDGSRTLGKLVTNR